MSKYWNIAIAEEDNTTDDGNIDVTGYGQIAVLLQHYVRKEKGKGLSSNDFTNNDKDKLNSIEVGAERNKLETLSINHGNIIHADSEKNINISIPTKISDLSNDIGYARQYTSSAYSDYRDSYVGKSKTSFEDEEVISIGKNAIACNNGVSIGYNSKAEDGGVAIGNNTCTDENHSINIYDKLKYNDSENVWEGKTTSSIVADCNTNGTNLTELDNVICNLADEISNRECEDSILSNKIITETTNRQNADGELNVAITCVSNRVTSIENKIPNQASSTNQLADKSFVNSTIQTATANYRGNWDTWNDVPSNASDYPQDYAGNRTPTVNDYLVVLNASDYSVSDPISGTWRFKYTGDWNVLGKNGWLPEYQVNEEPFTSEQICAINSGITCDKVTCYDNHLNDTSNPHNVTASQVGLGNVDNTADCEKTVKNSECFNGCTYACAKEDILSGNASTSTKFCTCHKINGTDFDGSADITTCCWGTARNIGIVNSDGTGSATTVSVNGCENVNLKLPSTIKACLDGTSCCSCCVYTECVNDNNTYYLTLSDSNTNGQKAIYTNTNLSYNPFTGVLCATCFCGAIASGGDVSICDIGACDSDIPIILCTGTTCVGRSTYCNLTFNTCNGTLCVENLNISCIETKKPEHNNNSCSIKIRTWSCCNNILECSDFYFGQKFVACNICTVNIDTSNINTDILYVACGKSKPISGPNQFSNITWTVCHTDNNGNLCTNYIKFCYDGSIHSNGIFSNYITSCCYLETNDLRSYSGDFITLQSLKNGVYCVFKFCNDGYMHCGISRCAGLICSHTLCL